VAFVSILLSSGPLDANAQQSNVRKHWADGWWLSDGYGLLLKVDGNILQAFELSSISCLPSWSAIRDPNHVRDAELVFRGDHSSVRFSVGTTADAMRMRRDGTVSDVLLRQVAIRPRSCGQAADNSPQANYAIFWQYLAYAKVARNNLDGALRFTEPQEVWVMPSTRPYFHGPVVLLIGPDTVSAGETFTMALMEREPHVTRIGLNTQGVFSDVLRRTLPNGWRFQLPNEKYLTKDRQSFDGMGVPPEIRTPFFSPGDIERGRDSALEAALQILADHGPGQ
jgi:hypothetical protein